MPIYTYEARDKSGQKVNGQAEFSDEKSALEKLTQQGYFVTEINEGKGDSLGLKGILLAFRGVKKDAIILFSRQLATMLRAGLSLMTCLNVLIKQTEDFKLRSALVAIRNDINAGNSFAQSLSKHPAIFSEIYVNTIRVGEETGSLEEILNRLASFAEWQLNLESRIKGSLFYPAAVITVAIAVVIFLLTFVIPKFAALFSRMNVPLPLITTIMVNIGNFFLKWWILIFAGVIGAIVGIAMFIRTKKGRFIFDRLKFKIPIVGNLVNKVVMLRFSRSLEIMLRNGVNIIKSLEVVSKGVGNVLVAQVLDDVRLNVHKGGGMAEILKQSPYFPPMVVAMITVGEESGSLDQMLVDIADNYEQQVEYISRNLTTMIEPILLVFLAIVVGMVAASLFLPIFKFMKVLR